MSTGTIFFSYSRQDSDFVIHLAQSLREAGAEVWLDQLDIKPGSRWDKSIEQALFKSSILLVVLSKSSVESANVMDEVSYALEEHKRVVPILLEDCDIPFRLRRLQFADFTKDRSDALKTLILSMGLEDHVATKLSNTAADHNLVEKSDPEQQPQEPVAQKVVIPVTSKKDQDQKSVKPVTGKSKMPIYIVLGVIGVGVAVWAGIQIVKPHPVTPDVADWQSIKDQNNAALYENHLAKFQPCEHKQIAQNKIDSLKPELPIQIPDTIIEPEPEPTLEELALAEEQKKWEAVKLLDKYANYLDFYKTHPDSEYRQEAKNKLIEYLDQSGFVYYGSKYTNYFDLAFEPQGDGVPVVDKFYVATQARTIRDSSDSNAPEAGFTKLKSLVFVEAYIESGSSYWVKIKFNEMRFAN